MYVSTQRRGDQSPDDAVSDGSGEGWKHMYTQCSHIAGYLTLLRHVSDSEEIDSNLLRRNKTRKLARPLQGGSGCLIYHKQWIFRN